MFDALKRIFKRSTQKPLFGAAGTGTDAEAEQAGNASSSGTNVLAFPKGGGTPKSSESKSSEPFVLVTFQSILKQMPPELQGKVSPPASAKFCLPASQVMDQLPKGAVKVSFGELRRAAPAGIFKNNSDQDGRLVDLPLREILPQLNLGAFSRSPQQRIEVSEEVTDLFGRNGELLARLRVVEKNEVKPQPGPVAKPTASAAPAPAAPAATSPAPETPLPIQTQAPKSFGSRVAAPIPLSSPIPKPSISAPAPLPKPLSGPAAKPTAPAPAPALGAVSETLTVPLLQLSKHWPEAINREIVQLNLLTAQCHLPLSQIGQALKNGIAQLPWGQVRSWIRPSPPNGVPSPHLETMLEIPLKLIASLNLAQTSPATLKKTAAVETRIPAPKLAAVIPPGKRNEPLPPGKPEPAAPKSEAGTIRVALSAVIGSWPAPLRAEITQAAIPDAMLEVPREAIEPGLKGGKVEFPWNQVQSWLRPAAPAGLGAGHSDTMVELPLPVMVPLLFSSQFSAAPKRPSLADEIPDVFSATRRANAAPPEQPGESAAAAPATPEIAPATPEKAPAAAAAAPAPKAPKDLAELFGEPDKRTWTPNEIVHKTTLLPDVSGALIALQDGLLVASCMPPNWKTETIAAFLPQIFGRMNQYAKELKMGELNSVCFTVDQGTLQIYNAGIIYFAALAQPGMPLPSSLNLIARELSRHTR